MPPLAGPRSIECCTLNPVNVSRVPSSICTGTCTMTSRLGLRSILHRPSSSLSFFAARSDRATCASQGLTSSRYAVAIHPPLHGATCWRVDPTVHPSFAYPALASFRMVISGSAFHNARLPSKRVLWAKGDRGVRIALSPNLETRGSVASGGKKNRYPFHCPAYNKKWPLLVVAPPVICLGAPT